MKVGKPDSHRWERKIRMRVERWRVRGVGLRVGTHTGVTYTACGTAHCYCNNRYRVIGVTDTEYGHVCVIIHNDGQG